MVDSLQHLTGLSVAANLTLESGGKRSSVVSPVKISFFPSFAKFIKEIRPMADPVASEEGRCRSGKKRVVISIEADEAALRNGGVLEKMMMIQSWIAKDKKIARRSCFALGGWY